MRKIAARLCQHVPNHVAAHVRQAHITPGVVVGEFGVVEAKQVQNGGVEVVDSLDVFGGPVADFIRGAVDGPAFQTEKARGLWSRPTLPSVNGIRPNSV